MTRHVIGDCGKLLGWLPTGLGASCDTGAVTCKSRVRYANLGWNGWRRGLCFLFFSKYLTLFASKMGSIINKHVLGSSQEGLWPIGGGYGPMAGVTTRTRGPVMSYRPCRCSDTQIAGALCKLGVERLAEGTMFLFFPSIFDINCE